MSYIFKVILFSVGLYFELFTDKKKRKFFSYIRKFRVELLQSHI
jgi:hypothetical protein